MIEQGFAVHGLCDDGCPFHYATHLDPDWPGMTAGTARTTVVAAVIERDGRVLIAQRKKTRQHPLKWEFPGGKVEPDEHPEVAVVRELKEELGITAQVDAEIDRYEYQYPGRTPILLIFYRIIQFSGEPRNLDFEQLVWAPREELGDYDFLEGDTGFLSRYQ